MRTNYAHIADRVMQRPGNNFKLLKRDYVTTDIIEAIKLAHKNGLNDTVSLARTLPGATIEQFTRNLYNLVKNNIAYKLDPEGAQFVKSPSQTWADKFADCKSYSVFIATTLHNKGIPYLYRFVSFSSENTPTHVYVIVPAGGKYIILDAVMPGYNQEKPFTFNTDIDMKGLYYVSGIGNIKEKPIPVKFDLMGRDLSQISDGEMDLLIARDHIETRKAINENIRGIGTLKGEQYADKIDVIDDALDVLQDYRVGATDTPELEMLEIAADAIDGLYGTSAEIMGIGDIGAKKAVRKKKKAIRRTARKIKRDTRKDARQEKKQIRKTTTGAARKEALQKVRAEKKTDIKAQKKIIDANRSKTGKFLKKAAVTAKKGVKAVTKVTTAPVRLVAKGILELTLPKASPFFLYLFVNDKAIIEKLPVKVREKRKKSEKVADFIVNGIGMKRKHFMGIVRNGIMKQYGKTPEKVIEEQMKGKIAGIGAITATVITAVITIINKISQFVKNRKAEKVTQADMPDPSDWGEITNPQQFQQQQAAESGKNLNQLNKLGRKDKRLAKQVSKLQSAVAKNPDKARKLNKLNSKLEKLNKATKGSLAQSALPKVAKFLEQATDQFINEPDNTPQVAPGQLAAEIKNQPENLEIDKFAEGNQFDAGGRSIWSSLDG